MNTSN